MSSPQDTEDVLEDVRLWAVAAEFLFMADECAAALRCMEHQQQLIETATTEPDAKAV